MLSNCQFHVKTSVSAPSLARLPFWARTARPYNSKPVCRHLNIFQLLTGSHAGQPPRFSIRNPQSAIRN